MRVKGKNSTSKFKICLLEEKKTAENHYPKKMKMNRCYAMEHRISVV